MRSGTPLLTAIEVVHPGSVSDTHQPASQLPPAPAPAVSKALDAAGLSSSLKPHLRPSGMRRSSVGQDESQPGSPCSSHDTSLMQQEAGDAPCSSDRPSSVARSVSGGGKRGPLNAGDRWASLQDHPVPLRGRVGSQQPPDQDPHAAGGDAPSASTQACGGSSSSGGGGEALSCVGGSNAYVQKVVSKLHALQRCNSAVLVASRVLHLPLVNIGGQDVAAGRASAILPLVNHLMRHHMGQLTGRGQALASGSAGGAAVQVGGGGMGWGRMLHAVLVHRFRRMVFMIVKEDDSSSARQLRPT